MRPLWERTLTWTVANHLYLGGVGYSQAYSAAALVVRDLDRRYSWTTELARFAPSVPADIDDPDKTSPRYLATMAEFWRQVGGPAQTKFERNRLLDLAAASLLRSSHPEIEAAAALANEARATIESYYGRLGAAFDEGTWGLRGLGGSFGALRDEMAATGSSEVLAAYDRLVAASRERAAVVERFQTWAKDLGWYTGRIDGIWGDLSEAAFTRAVPMAAGRLSELRDTIPLRPALDFSDASAIAVLITRDEWLGRHPDKIYTASTSPETAEAVDAGRIEVSYPKEDKTSSSTSTSEGGSQVVVTYPKATGGGEAQRVEITLPPPAEITASIRPVSGWRPSRNQLLVSGVVLTLGAVVGGAVWWTRRKRAA